MFKIESINLWGEYSRNMPMSEFFSNNCTIFAFDQSIISTLSCSALGLRSSEFFEKCCHLVVNEFTSIVRMEVFYLEWKSSKCSFEERQEKTFRNFFYRKNHFPLSHFIYEINMIYSFLSIQIPLMNSIYSYESRDSFWIWLHTNSNRNIHTSGFPDNK